MSSKVKWESYDCLKGGFWALI